MESARRRRCTCFRRKTEFTALIEPHNFSRNGRPLDTSQLFKLTCEIVGGLGIFLLGMKNMSDGMQAVAGSSLRRMISAVTSNRFMATVVGVVVTCVVQSSSVTTVMVVGFVNSGVMQLGQAIGVIMGANIGTTITGWILVLKIGKYGLPILGGSAFVYLFSKSDRWRYWAMALMGVGMVFFGLELMKDACSIIKEMPDFERWFQKFRADSYVGVLQCALAGCVLTTLVQSSSATLGITISLATQGVISYETAAALVLGENIGTTITAFLASLGATTNARRAAYFHVIFNLIGVLWITLIFQWYIGFIQTVVASGVNEVRTSTVVSFDVGEEPLRKVTLTVPRGQAVKNVVASGGPKIESWDIKEVGDSQQLLVQLGGPVAADFKLDVRTQRAPESQEGAISVPTMVGVSTAVEKGKETFPKRTAAIAATHSIFNIVNTLLFLPFGPMFVGLLTRLVPSKDFKEKPKLTDLDIRMLESPSLAIEQSRKEIGKMGMGCVKMMDWLAELRDKPDRDTSMADRLKQREQVLDSMQDEIAEFVTHLVSGNVSHAIADEARQQLRMADEYESVSDYIANLDKFDRKLRRDGHRFNADQRERLGSLHNAVAEYLAEINEAQAKGNRNVLTKTEPGSQRVKSQVKQLRRDHLEELSAGSTPPVISVAYLAALNAYSRVRDHAHNIAEVVSGEK